MGKESYTLVYMITLRQLVLQHFMSSYTLVTYSIVGHLMALPLLLGVEGSVRREKPSHS